MTKVRLLACCLLLAAAPAMSQPKQMESEVRPGPVAEDTARQDAVALGKDIADRMTVAVRVSGKGPYRFLVDTGSERTLISRQLARHLNLETGRVTKLHSVLGASDVSTVYIPRLTVSSNTISIIDAPALEASNIGADGMLGIDSLQSQRVMFDFKAKTMSIMQADAPLGRIDGDMIVVRARSRKGRLIFTDASISGQKVTVIVDTGSQITIGNLALQQRLGRRMRKFPQTVDIETVTGEKTTAQVATLSELKLDGLHLSDLSIAFANAHIFKQLGLEGRPALLLGMNAMRAFDRISIDFATKKVRFVLPGSSRRDTLRLAENERR